jgi:alpha-L-rhamnosidase
VQLRRFTELSLVNVSGTGLWTCDGQSYYCTKPEIDWPSGMRDGFVFVPADTVVNAYTMRAMQLFALMASDAGGHDADAAYFSAAATALRSAINDRLYNASCGCFEDGLGAGHSAWHSSVYALAFGVPSPDIAEAVYAHVVEGSVNQPGLCQPGNVYPAQWALEALYANTSDHGFNGLAFLVCNGTNAWLAQLRQGATTTMEAWNASEKPNLTWSHPWAASPADIILRWLLGIRPLSPGFTRVIIQPQLGTLTSARGTLPTLRGAIAVEVNQTLASSDIAKSVGASQFHAHLGPAAMQISFRVPGGVSARVCLPLSACVAGFVLFDAAQVQGTIDEDYVCVDPVYAGTHTATCPATGTGSI